MAQILYQYNGFTEAQFWRTVAECIIRYQNDHPHLSERFEKHDLFAAEFTLSCLNRLQLRDNQQMVNLSDPAGSLSFQGTLVNPIATYRPATTPLTEW